MSTFAQEAVGQHKGYKYSRSDNPTRTPLQECLAALEGANHSLVYTSGLAATDNLVRTLVRPGDHVVCGDDVYGRTYHLFDKVMRHWGVNFSYADYSTCDLEAATPAGTRLVWLETPTNPLFNVSDIRAACARSRWPRREHSVFRLTLPPAYSPPPLARKKKSTPLPRMKPASNPSSSARIGYSSVLLHPLWLDRAITTVATGASWDKYTLTDGELPPGPALFDLAIYAECSGINNLSYRIRLESGIRPDVYPSGTTPITGITTSAPQSALVTNRLDFGLHWRLVLEVQSSIAGLGSGVFTLAMAPRLCT